MVPYSRSMSLTTGLTHSSIGKIFFFFNDTIFRLDIQKTKTMASGPIT